MNSQEAAEAELRPVSVMLLVYKQQLLSLPLRDTKDLELKFKSKFFPCDSTWHWTFLFIIYLLFNISYHYSKVQKQNNQTKKNRWLHMLTKDTMSIITADALSARSDFHHCKYWWSWSYCFWCSSNCSESRAGEGENEAVIVVMMARL